MTAKKSGSISPNCPASGVLDFDNNCRADCYIPSKRLFVESAAVRQGIHELEDAHRDAQDCWDLLQRGVLPFLTWQESFATRSGSDSLAAL